MNEFADFIADALTSYIASNDSMPDFVIRQSEDEIVWVDVETQEFFLITVQAAKAQVDS